MPHNWIITCVTVLNILTSAISSSDDLLDEYVKHVEYVNSINQDHENFYLNNKLHQRNKRTIESDSNAIKSENFVNKFKSIDQSGPPELDSPSISSRNLLNYKSAVTINYKGRQRRDLSTSDINPWTHSEILDREGDVVLRWQPRHKEILFRVEARTRGYVGIGFSPNGGMAGADIVLGWVDDRSLKTHLLDCHGIPSQGSAPVRDEIDNYTVLKGFQNDTHTVIEFKRVLDTCDPDDYVLTDDTVKVIWALHDKDPRYEEELVYHGEKRGTQSIQLMGPPPVPKPSGPHIRYWDVTLKNFEVRNNMDTIYWCKIFKSPALNQRNHVIGFEPLVGPNHTAFAHHMILHECQLDPATDLRRWNEYASENGALCYGDDMPPEWYNCITATFAWAIGSKGEFFPKDVGIPLDYRQSAFYMMEMHFDNPNMKKARDTTGLRLHYTPELRKYEGGVFAAGVFMSTLHFIPPFQKEYKSAGYCSFGCTKQVLPKDGINVVSVLLHSHLAGRKMKLRHIRGGKELPPIVEDNNWDFNFQQSRTLTPNAIILPGDALITECVYSTINRKKPTLGGYSSRDEMCLSYILYYPKIELSGCYSMPPIKYFFEILGVKQFYGYNMTDVENLILQGENEIAVSAPTPSGPLFPNNPGDEDSPEANRKAILALMNAKEYIIEGESSMGINVFDKLVIKEPLEFRNKTFTQHLQDIPYNETLITKKMEEFFYNGLHFTFCRKRDDTPATKETIEPFPNFTAYSPGDQQIMCSYKNKRSSSAALNKPNITLIFVILVTALVIKT